MSAKQGKQRRVLHDAVSRVDIEPLEQRRLLSTTCLGSTQAVIRIFGDDSNTANNIVLSLSGSTLTVTDSAAGADSSCAAVDVGSATEVDVYGGHTTSSTSTGNDT